MTFLRTALVLALLNLTVHAQGKNPDASDASAAIVPGGVAIYAMLTNPTMYDVYVQSGVSDAGKIELREDGKPTSNITIPAYGSVELKADGPFVLVSELKGQPKAGETINLKLMTDGGVAIAIAAIVR
ncbi:MAG TPA: copper chaperone PCu(A)C [Vicinamibacterales bacterium]|nr:copper chaperone PCu(A)C [Vicinamibacterales bacterium]